MIFARSVIQAVLLPVPIPRAYGDSSGFGRATSSGAGTTAQQAKSPAGWLILTVGVLLAAVIIFPAGAEEKLETITVTASPLSTDSDKFAAITGQVTRDDIVRSGGASLADALRDVPGVTGSGFAAGASRPVIRGFNATRVRMLEDGVGSFDVSDVGPDHGVPIDPLSAQKIEVIRGAATLRYGSQAIGGVVNTINNRIPRELPDDAVAGEVTGSYGSGAVTRQGSGMVDARTGQFALHADGFLRHSSDYGIPGGSQSNSYFRGDGYSFGGSYFFGAGDLSRAGAAVGQ